MTRFDLDDDDVVAVVGSGPGGATLALRLVQAGLKVVMFEAGPHLDSDDFVNDERTAFTQMSWLDPRRSTGTFGLAESSPAMPAWTGKLVGGTATMWTGLTPRFKEHELRPLSAYGEVPGASLLDWPVGLEELAPYYDEAEIAVGSSHRHGRPALPANNNYRVFANAAERYGYRHYATGPYAVNAEPYDGRPATIQDGFANQGDKNRSRWSPLVREIPRALATGLLDLRPESHVVRVTMDSARRADGVVYATADGTRHRQRARVVVIAGNAIETPRLLLLSAAAGHANGLGNGSDHVGRHYTRHVTGFVYARFDRVVDPFKGEPMAGIISDESRHDPARGFVGGYYLELISQGLPSFSRFVMPGGWGRDYAEMIEGYRRTSMVWICGEDLPRATNRITLADDLVDHLGLPAPEVHVDDHPNDTAMREHAFAQTSAMYRSLGAEVVRTSPPAPSGHNMGTARMSADAADGVTDRFGRLHEVENVYVADGSLFPSSGAANPTLTIVALAMRQGDRILEERRAGVL